ncbi:hypothetical protein GCM10027443_39840 [Pontibacter brevis]
MKEEKKKSERPNRMEQDVENTSRTMKPGSVQGSEAAQVCLKERDVAGTATLRVMPGQPKP